MSSLGTRPIVPEAGLEPASLPKNREEGIGNKYM
jgi:hypothetical protein